ncbi:MAG: hypothetical protein ACYTF5_13145 [Planctomycetota bacterium]|jgi:hypothetical protein
MKKWLVVACAAGLAVALLFFAVFGFGEGVQLPLQGVGGSQPGAADQEQPSVPKQAADQDARRTVEVASDEPRSGPDAPPVVLRIRVLRYPGRSPVAGARVSIVDFALLMQRIEAMPQPNTRAERRVVRDAIATVVETDAAGMVRLAPPGKRHSIEATHGSLFGRRYVHKMPKAPIEILIAEDRTLRVQVLSAATRQPVAGVPVTFSSRGSGSGASTDADGYATWQHVQASLLERTGWEVSLAIPLRKRVTAPVSLETLTLEPIVLLLPETGGLVVRIRDENGRPVSGKGIRLELEAFATFLRVTAKASKRESLHRSVLMDVDGPRQPGEIVTCDLLWGSAADPRAYYPVVTGRFVHRDGKPWSEAEAVAWPSIFPYRPRHLPAEKIHVADDGGFRMALREPCPAGGRRIYRIYTKPTDEHGRIECRLDLSRNFPAGETDLGDVVLDRGVLLVAGQVVDDAGNPLPKAQVHVTQLVVGKRQDLWPSYDCSGGWKLTPKGEFALYSIPGQPLPLGRLRLRVYCRGLLSNNNVGFRMGTKGLRVVLQRGGGVTGSVALADGQAAEDIRIALYGNDSNSRRQPLILRKDGSFSQQGLRPGHMRLVACLNSGVKEVREASRVEIDGIMITPGETNKDPRIQGIKIIGSVPRLKITVVDESGRPIAGARAAVLSQKGAYSGIADSRGRLILRPTKLPADIEVAAFGFRKKRLAGLRKDQEVSLARGLAVRFVTDATPIGRDPAYHLGFFLFHVDTRGRRGNMVYGSLFPYDRMYFDENGETRLLLPRAGIYELSPRIFLSGKDGVGTGGTVRQEKLLHFTVKELETEQTFRFPISAAALAETVRRYAR